jgi:hypothetical protein
METEVAAEEEEGLEEKQDGEKEVNLGTSQDEGDEAGAESAENGARLDGKIKFGRRRRTESNTFGGILHRRGLKIEKIVAVKGV